MVATSTVRTVVTVLLAIDIIWLIYILFRGYTESLVRTIVFAVILGITLGYLQSTKLEYLSFKAIKNDLFPPKIPRYVYTISETDTQDSHRIIYNFLPPETLERTAELSSPPELKVVMDPNGKTFTIEDPESLNLVLDQLNLPRVKHGAKELFLTTGSQSDIGVYRWDDYQLGTLIIERQLFQKKNSMQSYNAIGRIIIDSRRY
ncbi:MAG: hypothetical protein ACPLRA_00255 [Candidatus Saccharicenans sp.]